MSQRVDEPSSQPPPLPRRTLRADRRPVGFSLQRLVWVGLILVLSVGVLHYFPPGSPRANFYPPCALHRLTGLHCPGCGTTRALALLTHGELQLAWRCNALFVSLLPLLAWGLICAARNWVLGRPLTTVPGHPWSIVALLSLITIFGLVRNLPGPLGQSLQPPPTLPAPSKI